MYGAVKVKPILQWRSEIREVCHGKLQALGGNGQRETDVTTDVCNRAEAMQIH